MKTACIAILLALTFASIGLAATPTPAVPALPTGDEFTALRMAFAAQPDFSPFWTADPEREAILASIKQKDYPKTLALSKPWLAKVPVDADIHLARAQACKRTGDTAGSMYHFHFFYGLLHSIAASGDGKSAKTAFKVISVSEEYYLLDEIRAQLIDQSLVTPCDLMHVKLADGTEATLYFDVSISLAATARQFKPGTPKAAPKKP